MKEQAVLTKALLSLAVLLGWSVLAHAQVGVCPAGMIPGGDQYNPGNCVPDPSYQQQQQTQQPQRPPPPKPIWADRWGALATDDAAGILGTSTNKFDETQAKDVALADCQAKGGKKCELIVSYKNRCIAMAIGKPKYNVSYGPTIGEATKASMRRCGKEASGCHVYYTACSYPVRIQ